MNRQEAEQLKVFRTTLEMSEGQVFHLRFGPLDLYIQKNHNEISLRWMTTNDWMDNSFHYQFPFESIIPLNLLQEKRYASHATHPIFKVVPYLAELPFVVKPDTPFMILPGEKAKIFLSTPMNIRLVDLERDQTIDEVPVLKRVKTWFGDSHLDGELCFFTKIRAALTEDHLPFRPHRAQTHLYIENSSKEPIPIEKLKIPVPILDLYQDERGQFVTSSLSLKSDARGRLKDLKTFPPQMENGELFHFHAPRSAIRKMSLNSITQFLR